MYFVTGRKVGTLQCMTREDALEAARNGDPIYQDIYSLCDKLCGILGIECPDISVVGGIQQLNTHNGSISEEAAMTFHTKDHPDLNNNVLLVAGNCYYESNGNYGTSVVAHELRHIYQYKYTPELCEEEKAQGYYESLDDPAEIDSDGFAIAYLMSLGFKKEKAGEIVCPEEARYNPAALKKRLQKAEELFQKYFKKKAERRGSFLKKIMDCFTK